MLNFELRRLMECTREDKLACLPLIDKIVGLANTARSQGLLALEDIIPDLGDYLLKTGISMLVDGRDQDTTYEIMTTHIIASYKTGVDLLRQMIICDGVLAIQAGVSPRLISEKLVSYLGEDIILELIEQANEDVEDSGNNNGRKTDDENESVVINEDSSDALKAQFPNIFDSLTAHNDQFFVLKDFDAYVAAQQQATALYRDTEKWSQMAAMNIAHSGIFASDETIKRYAEEIWKV